MIKLIKYFILLPQNYDQMSIKKFGIHFFGIILIKKKNLLHIHQ